MNDQNAKADAGKPDLTLVPTQIIYEIEKIRNYGTKKYGDRDNWKKVSIERYWKAVLRHTLAAWSDPFKRDDESHFLHISHIVCNIAFILELTKEGKKGQSVYYIKPIADAEEAMKSMKTTWIIPEDPKIVYCKDCARSIVANGELECLDDMLGEGCTVDAFDFCSRGEVKKNE